MTAMICVRDVLVLGMYQVHLDGNWMTIVMVLMLFLMVMVVMMMDRWNRRDEYWSEDGW